MHAFENFSQRWLFSVENPFFYSYAYIAKETLLLFAEFNQGKSKF